MSPAKFSKAIEAAAVAAHDRYYDINAGCSDMSLMFETESVKAAWREVALAAIVALEETE